MDAPRQRPIYANDLTAAEWQWISLYIPPEKGGGRHRDTDLRAVVHGILYLLRSGCAWRLLPKEYPPWQTVAEYFSQWRKDGTLAGGGLWQTAPRAVVVESGLSRGGRPAAVLPVSQRRHHALADQFSPLAPGGCRW